jgi:hypothetical protein
MSLAVADRRAQRRRAVEAAPARRCACGGEL